MVDLGEVAFEASFNVNCCTYDMIIHNKQGFTIAASTLITFATKKSTKDKSLK